MNEGSKKRKEGNMPDLENDNLEQDNLEQEQEVQGGTGQQTDDTPAPGQEQEEQEISRDPVGDLETEEQPVSRRESKRIQQLLDKFAQSDEARFRRNQRQPQPQRQRGRQIIPEGDYDIDDINGIAAQYGENEFARGLSQAQALHNANTFATRMEIDAPRVNSKHAFLDKESEDFLPGAAVLVNRMYLNTVGYDPYTGAVQDSSLRYGEFVDAFMEVVEMIALGKTADSTRNVAHQAAQTGIRPGGTRPPVYRGADPKKMTDAQLDAVIAQQLRQ